MVNKVPIWFKVYFINSLKIEDLKRKIKNNNYVIIYFHKNGYYYCDKLIKNNFRYITFSY